MSRIKTSQTIELRQMCSEKRLFCWLGDCHTTLHGDLAVPPRHFGSTAHPAPVVRLSERTAGQGCIKSGPPLSSARWAQRGGAGKSMPDQDLQCARRRRASMVQLELVGRRSYMVTL